MRKNCATPSLAAWKQPWNVCALTTFRNFFPPDLSHGHNLVHGEGTSLSRVGPYRFCGGGALDKPSWGYRFRVGPYRFCSDGNPTTLSILLWSYLILSDTHFIFLLISFTLSTHTRTTLTVFQSWTRTSTSESGHHQPNLLRKEIGVNEDNSPKQAAGTMRKNCATPSLAVSKQPFTFCALTTLRKLFLLISFTLSTHTRTTLTLFKSWTKTSTSESGPSPAKTAPKGNRFQWGQLSKASSRNFWNQRQG